MKNINSHKKPKKRPRILLVNSSFPSDSVKIFGEGGKICAPMGLLLIASILKREGYDACLVDPQLTADPLIAIAENVKEGALFVGITAFIGPNVLRAREISDLVKKISPKTPVVWGGPLPTSAPEICLRDAMVDYIVMGMGEETILELARCIETKQDPAKLSYISTLKGGALKAGEIYRFTGELDNLPYPDLELWKEGVEKLKSIPIITSRGCPRNCAFCYNNTFSGKKRWLANSAEYIIKQMEHWSGRFGFKSFYFVDDNFLVDTKRAKYILEHALSKSWHIQHLAGHISDFKPEIIKLIKGNINNVGFAIESASPKIQRLINKHVNLDSALGLIHSFTEAKTEAICINFMLGFPSETDEDIAASIKAAQRIRDLNPTVRSIPSIYLPQPKDDIMPQFDFASQKMFSLDTLSSDMASHRSGFLESRLRPWMKEEDITFYIDLLRTWFYHFDCKVRDTSHFDISSIMKRNKRVANLFAEVSAP